MKRLKRNGLASALLAGAALIALPAMAQDLPKKADAPAKAGESAQTQRSDRQPVHKLDGGRMEDSNAGKTTDAGMKSDEDGNAGMKAAKQDAPGQRKQGEAKSATEAAPGQRQKEGEVDSAKEAAPGHAKTQAAEDKPSNETTASVDITTEKRTEIKQVIHETDVKPVHVDVDVSVGVAIPHKVELHPLPPRIVEIVPAYEGYDYFVLADGRIIIVEPSTYKVVYIISA